MKFENSSFSPRLGYFALFAISLVIPSLYFHLLDEILELTRFPPGGLLPFPYLTIKWLGALSCGGPIVFLSAFLLSWRFPDVNSPSTLAILAIAYAACMTVYAFFTSFSLVLVLEGIC